MNTADKDYRCAGYYKIKFNALMPPQRYTDCKGTIYTGQQYDAIGGLKCCPECKAAIEKYSLQKEETL